MRMDRRTNRQTCNKYSLLAILRKRLKMRVNPVSPLSPVHFMAWCLIMHWDNFVLVCLVGSKHTMKRLKDDNLGTWSRSAANDTLGIKTFIKICQKQKKKKRGVMSHNRWDKWKGNGISFQRAKGGRGAELFDSWRYESTG
jgi:hypothetical protein